MENVSKKLTIDKMIISVWKIKVKLAFFISAYSDKETDDKHNNSKYYINNAFHTYTNPFLVFKEIIPHFQI